MHADETTTRPARRAFTLIELLVVIAIIALLIGILLPSLGAARNSAKMAKGASNLRQLGVGFVTYSVDNEGYYCSGPWWNRKNRSFGSIEDAGWVADMVNGQYAVPGNLLSPGNPAMYSQQLILNTELNDGDVWKPFTVEERDSLVERGYNTNYTQSWVMAHTDMLDRRTPSDLFDPRYTYGPLRDTALGNASTSRIPLVGDGHTDLDDQGEYILINGERLPTAKLMTDGPRAGAVGPDGLEWRWQDFSDFGPAYATGRPSFLNSKGHSRIAGQLVFADGHVDTFNDANRDGEFAPDTDDSNRPLVPVEYSEFEGKVFYGSIISGRP